MKQFISMTLLAAFVLVLAACTTREMATGAAAGAVGYVIGREVED